MADKCHWVSQPSTVTYTAALPLPREVVAIRHIGISATLAWPESMWQHWPDWLIWCAVSYTIYFPHTDSVLPLVLKIALG